jgi:hypothetical protein
MDISTMLNQTATWTPRTGDNNRGEAAYGEVESVQARVVPKSRDIIGPTGEVTTIAYQFVTFVQPAVGDLLNGREVVQTTGMVDFTGADCGTMSLTR